MAANSNRLRGALLASSALVAGVSGSARWASTASAQNILPTNGVITSGAASIRQSSADLSIVQTSPRAIVNWGSFSIGQSNAVTFDQPSASSAILNRVTGSARSSIAGQLQANGQVYLVNPNGIAITPTGAVQVGGGFVASTLGIADRDFNSGNLRFTGNGASAGVSNAGSIEAGPGGFVGLVGGTVANSGVVSVPLGKVGMGSGEQATLNLTGDNFLQVAVPTNAKTADGKALIDVSGKVVAAGGRVELRAATVAQAIRNAVNVPGSLSVASARAVGGSIILSGGAGGDVSATGRLSAAGRTKGGAIAFNGHNVALRHARLVASSAKGKGGSATVTGTNAVSLASTSVDASGATGGGAIRIGGDFHGASDIVSAKTTTIDSGSTLNASATGSGNGGTVAVWSETATGFAGKITATGGPKDGNGGYVEISADPGTHGVLDFIGSASLTAAKGTTGTLLLDPYNITISTGTDAGGSFSGGNPNNWNPTATSVINNVTLENQLAISNVIISTGFSGSPGTDAGNLVVSAPVAWSANSNLTLDAFNNLSIGAPISTTGAGSLTLLALNGVTNILSPVSTTTGAIALTGATGIGLSANVRTSGGGITLFDAVTLGANATINSGAGTTTFVSTVDGDHTLTVSSGAVGFDGNIGSVTPLAGLTVTGSTSLFGNVTTDNGAITFNSPVTLDRNVTLNAGTGTIKFASAVDSGPTGFSSPCGAGCDLTVSGGAVTLGGNVGSAVPLGSLSVTGPTTLAGNVTTNNGDISFNSSLQLQGSVTVNSGSGATVAFDGTVDSAPAFPSSGLTVTTGDMFTGGAFGGTNPLGVVSLTAVDGLSLPSIAATGDITLNNPAFLNGNITTSGGNIHFLDTVELESNVTLSAPSGTVTFGSTVDSDPSGSCSATCDLTVSASAISFGGALGDLSALGAVSLTSTGAMTLPSIAATSILAHTTGAAANLTVGAGATLAASPITLKSNAGQVAINGAIDSSGNVILDAGGDIIESFAGSVTAAALAATSTGGAVVMTNFENSVPSVSGSAPDGFSFYTFGTSGLTLTGLNVGGAGIASSNGSIALETVEGPITQTGRVRGLALWAHAGVDGTGDVILNNAGNAVGTLAGAASGSFQYANTSGAGLTIGTVTYFVSSETDIPDSVSGAGVSSVTSSVPGAEIQVSTAGNLVLDSVVQGLIPNGLIELAATGNFINNVGPGAVVDPWQIYSASPTGDVFNGLDSGNTAVWDTTFGQAVAATGNRYIFAFQPTITVTSTNDSKTYGQDVTSRVATDYVISGLEPGVAGAFLGDSAASVFSGTPSVTSLGSPARAPVSGSPYPITVAQGTFTVSDRYALVLDSAGRLTVDPLALTYAVADATSTYGTTPTLGAATLFGILPGDTVIPTVGIFSGATSVAISPRTPVGAYSEEVTALSNSDYTIAPAGNAPGTLTVGPKGVTYAVANATSVFGTFPILGAAALFGVLPGDVVTPTVGAFTLGGFHGLVPVALTPFTPVGQYAELVTALSNPDYRIAPAPNLPGVLTITAATANPGAPTDPGFLPGLTQINNPARTEYDVGGYEQVLPRFTVNCNEPPSLPDPNGYSDPDQALRAISQSMDNYFKRCENPTQTTIANALDEYAAKLQILAPRLPPALRNVPAIIAQSARRVRAARSRSEAVAILHQTVAAIHKEIGLVLSEDPETRGRELRDGDVIAGALDQTSIALVNSGGL